MTILKIFKKFKENRRRKRIIRKLISDYELTLAIDRLMEDWITKRILDGQQGRREELVEKQKRITETELFVNYLKNL